MSVLSYKNLVTSGVTTSIVINRMESNGFYAELYIYSKPIV